MLEVIPHANSDATRTWTSFGTASKSCGRRSSSRLSSSLASMSASFALSFSSFFGSSAFSLKLRRGGGARGPRSSASSASSCRALRSSIAEVSLLKSSSFMLASSSSVALFPRKVRSTTVFAPKSLKILTTSALDSTLWRLKNMAIAGLSSMLSSAVGSSAAPPSVAPPSAAPPWAARTGGLDPASRASWSLMQTARKTDFSGSERSVSSKRPDSRSSRTG
mmetsp:Transcript_36937/g.82764  ORF Transcript_36937/g.82764 Transcript_36937/m.82764 type:complete len:221 (+) Transcript_36937:1104-1766(+)